ncbi:hsp70 nucleotide exchange factor fes1 [Ascosphaera atra]|nr:hsp70 nucleotide exchange factor fes1 [Ascosphaera atra]
MAAIKNKAEIPLGSRLVAWDNFEQLIENLDNANNMDNLGLWAPLKEELGAEEGEERVFAAWCVGTSVQNNVKAQAMVVLPALTSLALADPNPAVRKKAVFALSSSVRNFQPGLDEVVRCLKEGGHEGLLEGDDSVKAGDMDRVDRLISKLREGTQTQTQTQGQGQGQ